MLTPKHLLKKTYVALSMTISKKMSCADLSCADLDLRVNGDKGVLVSRELHTYEFL